MNLFYKPKPPAPRRTLVAVELVWRVGEDADGKPDETRQRYRVNPPHREHPNAKRLNVTLLGAGAYVQELP